MESHVELQPVSPEDLVKLYYMLEMSHLLLRLLYVESRE